MSATVERTVGFQSTPLFVGESGRETDGEWEGAGPETEPTWTVPSLPVHRGEPVSTASGIRSGPGRGLSPVGGR